MVCAECRRCMGIWLLSGLGAAVDMGCGLLNMRSNVSLMSSRVVRDGSRRVQGGDWADEHHHGVQRGGYRRCGEQVQHQGQSLELEGFVDCHSHLHEVTVQTLVCSGSDCEVQQSGCGLYWSWAGLG